MPSKRQRRIKKIDNDSILDQIERVVRWGDEFRLAFVKCNHPAQQETLRRSLLERLSDQRVLEILLEKPIVSLLDEISPLWNPDQPPAALCIYGLEHSLREQGQNSPVLGRLNHDRNLLRQSVPAALLIWLPDFALDYVARGAPDFWAWRSGVYEFQTDSVLWQMESIAAFGDHDTVSLGSLSWEDKQKEIARLEELLRTSQALTRQDRQVKQINCRLLQRLGFLYDSFGKQDKAIDRYQESLKLAKDLGDRAREGEILNNLSLIYIVRGNRETALRYLEESLAISRALGDRAGEGIKLNNLSSIYFVQRDYATTLRYQKESLNIMRSIGDQVNEGVALRNLSQVYHDRGDYDTALHYLEESLALSRAISNRTAEGETLNAISMIYQAREDRETALKYLKESLAISRALGDRAGEGMILNSIWRIYDELGDYETALKYLKESLAIRRTIDTWAKLCTVVFNVGRIHLHNNEQRQALAYFVEAYRIAKENGFSEALINLEKLAKKLGGNGLEYWEQQLARSTTNTQPQTKQRQVG